jgi:hypothetical protein
MRWVPIRRRLGVSVSEESVVARRSGNDASHVRRLPVFRLTSTLCTELKHRVYIS